MAEIMGGLLAKAEAFVLPGAFRGIEAGGVQADARVEKGAIVGIERDGVNVNVNTGGSQMTSILLTIAILYFLTLMPIEATYLIVLVVSGLLMADGKYQITAAIVGLKVLLRFVISSTIYLSERKIGEAF